MELPCCRSRVVASSTYLRCSCQPATSIAATSIAAREFFESVGILACLLNEDRVLFQEVAYTSATYSLSTIQASASFSVTR